MKKTTLLLLVILIIVGLFLRFKNLDQAISYTWDQGRDAWVMRRIFTEHNFPLIGPQTGIGHFHLGVLYYYVLAGFYALSGLDPMGASYYAVFVTLATMLILFLVGQAIFNEKTALFSVLFYAFSRYLIITDRTPWNVSLVVAVSALILYSLFKVHQGKYKWAMVAAGLVGLFFHLHFTAVFLVPAILISLLIFPNKRKVFLWGFFGGIIGILLFVPNIIHQLNNSFEDYYRFREFWQYYYHGFHLRFLPFRIADTFIMFKVMLFFKEIDWLKYLLPIIFVGISFVSSDKSVKFLGRMALIWFLSILFGFTIYNGPVSDYYFLLAMPIVIYVLSWFATHLLFHKNKFIMVVGLLFCLLWVYKNTESLEMTSPEGLKGKKEEVKKMIEKGEKLNFVEGEIRYYLYDFYKNQK